MQAPSGQMTAPALEALLTDGPLAGSWVLDPRRSSIRLENKSMWGLVRVTGEFREISGTGIVTADGQVSGTINVVAASVDTKNAKRDTHLRSADFFDTDHHPDITFTVDGMVPSDAGVAVSGTLTVRGRARRMFFHATASVPADGEISLDAVIPVNRADFGLTWNLLGTVSMHNTLTIHAVFTPLTPLTPLNQQ